MARDRYLWNSGEETINSGDVNALPKDPKGKWENFWYYNKIKLLVIAIAVAMVGSFIYEMVSKVEPDYQIALLTQKSYSSDMITQFQDQIAQYGEDLDGDGKVVVQINTYTIVMDDSVEVTDPSLQMAGVARFSVDMQEGDSFIYITDDASFLFNQTQRQLFSYLDGTIPAADATDYENMRIPWADCAILGQMKPDPALTPYTEEGYRAAVESLNNLSVSLRQFEGTLLEEEKGKPEYYDACLRLFNKLVYGK